jgi:hypothetical protein
VWVGDNREQDEIRFEEVSDVTKKFWWRVALVPVFHDDDDGTRSFYVCTVGDCTHRGCLGGEDPRIYTFHVHDMISTREEHYAPPCNHLSEMSDLKTMSNGMDTSPQSHVE